MKKLQILTILFSIYSCSPQQKLNRLIKNHPELAQTTVKENTITITEIDTIFIPEHLLDTTVRISDTVQVEDSIVYVQIIKNDTVYKIITKVKPRNIIVHDTLVYTYKDTVNTFTYNPLTFKEKSKYRGQGNGSLFGVRYYKEPGVVDYDIIFNEDGNINFIQIEICDCKRESYTYKVIEDYFEIKKFIAKMRLQIL